MAMVWILFLPNVVFILSFKFFLKILPILYPYLSSNHGNIYIYTYI